MMNSRKQRTRQDSGFVLLAMGVSVVVLLGMLGLALDLGRAFIVRNEAQAFTDAASLAAVARLNGTSAGVTAAQAAVTNSTNRWNFTSQAFGSVTTEFSTDKVTWTDAGSSPTTVKFVRVIAPTNSVAMTVLRAVPGTSDSIVVAARSTAGVVLPTSFGQGVFPFAPLAHDQAGPDFGYTPGDELTLLWPSSIGSNGQAVKRSNLCLADQTDPKWLAAVQDGTTADRGYIQDTSASSIASAIEDDHMDYTVTLGLAVSRSGGVKNTDVYQSLQNRVDQDSSPNTIDYTGYVAGHDSEPMRRKVIVPIINNATDAIVLGFVYVFLPAKAVHSPNDAKCAIYIGPADGPGANLANGANSMRLVE